MTEHRDDTNGSISRRRFLGVAGAAGLAGVAAATVGQPARAAGTAAARAGASGGTPLPGPTASGIDHVVVVCMENRSFDHFLGWVPGADGHQAGLSYPDTSGHLHRTHHLTEWTGCGFSDPDHSVQGGRTQLAGGRMDGFRRGNKDDYALGYYLRADLPTNSFIADHFTICDRWFCSFLGPTYPNRFYTHAATTDRTDNTSDVSTLPTVWDRLSAAGVPATYYFSDVPFLALWGDRYLKLASHVDSFYAQAASGTLPSFSYLDPFFVGEDQGGSADDHPHADIRRGQAFLAQVIAAVMDGPLWSRTLLVITYDEWGGFFDHVRPPRLPDRTGPEVAGLGLGQAGFRVPGYLISPFARAGHVDHTPFDHASILRFLEWRFRLKPLQPRDAAANNLAAALDFTSRNRTPAGAVPTVIDPGPHYCNGSQTVGVAAPAGRGGGMADSEEFWSELASSPLTRRWRSL